ncbi:4Fe-4S dicluster domain-containing protein [Candidatus Clostridium stratigraminis]|uniref:4Fe-4S dicluster domain-containing protein n=1 Tax=Candidatus Clostridium stratigraminis TaxID=3381661 RepID=A0ABW8T1Q4_9CLOT
MKKPKYDQETLECINEIANNCTSCKKCMRECIMLNDFGNSPSDIFKGFLQEEEIKPIIPYSCTMCNKCRIVCPKKLDIPKGFMKLREAIIKSNGGRTALKGHKAVYVHQLLSCGFLKIFTTRR